jgi:hypothetical protein
MALSELTTFDLDVGSVGLPTLDFRGGTAALTDNYGISLETDTRRWEKLIVKPEFTKLGEKTQAVSPTDALPSPKRPPAS